jgi:arylsulfatase A-like enzyme
MASEPKRTAPRPVKAHYPPRKGASTVTAVRSPICDRAYPRAPGVGTCALTPQAAHHGQGQGLESWAPYVILILADDLGYGDLGCYGQTRIRTPSIDRMAAEGLRFTQHYAGSSVCAPSRCSLVTGYHQGHAWVRGNVPRLPLRAEDVTIAKVLKNAGYTTALIGKWGLGEPETTGLPTRQGFELFFGYLNQKHAHDYYTDHLWRGEQRVSLAPGSYTHDLFTREALDLVGRAGERPFFLLLAYTLPHANNERGAQGMEVATDAPYSSEPWPQQERNYAAMVTLLDRDVGRLLAAVRDKGLDDRTIVLLTSDNGPHSEGGHDAAFFASAGRLRGIKRSLYEGGLRVPMIVRWPGRVEAGRVSEQVWANWDLLPTLAEMGGARRPAGIDGRSMLRAIVGRSEVIHEAFYWELAEGGFAQAMRLGQWKAVRPDAGRPLELYDLARDPGETTNVARRQRDLVAKIERLMEQSRTDSAHWPRPTTRPERAPHARSVTPDGDASADHWAASRQRVIRYP